MADFEARMNDRVVLTCKNHLSYAGVLRGSLRSFGERESVVVELDAESGFSILCPTAFVEKITVVPLPKAED